MSDSINSLISQKLEERELRGARQTRTNYVLPIDQTQPWASRFGLPTSVTADLPLVRVAWNAEDNTLRLVLPDGTFGPVFQEAGLQALGLEAAYKNAFVRTLSGPTQALVINECIAKHRHQDVQFIGESGSISSVSAGWREICSHAEVCQVAYNTLASIPEFRGAPTIKSLSSSDQGMTVRMLTNLEQPVTRQVGDVLRAGVKIEHRFGKILDVGLFVERLVCLNGMTREMYAFNWQNRQGGTVHDQLDYMVASLNGIRENFSQLVERARTMANTPIHGDPRDALISRARAMRIPERHLTGIVSAFEAEPGNTEWAMQNAFTRFASHTVIEDDPALSDRIQTAAGNWAYNFDLVDCRLPRPLAERFGAEITSAPAS